MGSETNQERGRELKFGVTYYLWLLAPQRTHGEAGVLDELPECVADVLDHRQLPLGEGWTSLYAARFTRALELCRRL